jgi:hypothetical protein
VKREWTPVHGRKRLAIRESEVGRASARPALGSRAAEEMQLGCCRGWQTDHRQARMTVLEMIE